MTRRDEATIDLFRDFEPWPAVERFDEADIHAGTLSGRLKRAIAKALKDCVLKRGAPPPPCPTSSARRCRSR